MKLFENCYSCPTVPLSHVALALLSLCTEERDKPQFSSISSMGQWDKVGQKIRMPPDGTK